MGHVIECPAGLAPEQKLKLLCDTSWLSPYPRTIVETLLPESDDLKYKEAPEFDPSNLSEADKAVRRSMMAEMGFTSPKRKDSANPLIDNFPLKLAFTDNLVSIVQQLMRQLNKLRYICDIDR